MRVAFGFTLRIFVRSLNGPHHWPLLPFHPILNTPFLFSEENRLVQIVTTREGRYQRGSMWREDEKREHVRPYYKASLKKIVRGYVRRSPGFHRSKAALMLSKIAHNSYGKVQGPLGCAMEVQKGMKGIRFKDEAENEAERRRQAARRKAQENKAFQDTVDAIVYLVDRGLI